MSKCSLSLFKIKYWDCTKMVILIKQTHSFNGLTSFSSLLMNIIEAGISVSCLKSEQDENNNPR